MEAGGRLYELFLGADLAGWFDDDPGAFEDGPGRSWTARRSRFDLFRVCVRADPAGSTVISLQRMSIADATDKEAYVELIGSRVGVFEDDPTSCTDLQRLNIADATG